jgi:hypothetical protein
MEPQTMTYDVNETLLFNWITSNLHAGLCDVRLVGKPW